MTYEEFVKQKRTARRNRHLEDALQTDCVRWFRDSFPELAALLFHPNNEAFFGGSGRTPSQQSRAGQRAKDMGVVPGVADLILLYPSRGKAGLCIEMKSKTGTQRDTQKNWQKAVEGVGYEYQICKTRVDFRKIIVEYTGKTPLDPDEVAMRKLGIRIKK